MSSKDKSLTVGCTGKTLQKPPQHHWFISEIQQMMHGLGDCRRPLKASAVLIEEVTQQQMITLLYKASDVANLRGAKLIGVEDMLFLMRRDKCKLRRLLRYMDMKDLKTSIKRSSADDEEGIELETKPVQPFRKRRKICYDFLSSIDQTGEYLDLFEDESVDDIKYERLLRAELRSRCLDPKQYMEYCLARQTNFGKKYKSQRFRDWLLAGVSLDIKPSIHALELISYLAYETVAQIVDLSLLVKQDQQASIGEPLCCTMPSFSHNLHETSVIMNVMGQAQKNIGLSSPSGSGSSQLLETPLNKSIQPGDIKEALRRYNTFIGPFASELKFNSQLSPKILTLSI